MIKELINRVDFKPSRYLLRREGDGAGDSGLMLLSINPKTAEEIPNAVVVGACCRVGSPFGRTYEAYDFWTTTPVTELWQIGIDVYGFKTQNSEYVLEIF